MRASSLSRLAPFAPFALAAACASAAPPDAPGVSTLGATTASDLAGTYAFAIDESDVAAPLRAKCAAQSNGDAAKADACYAEIRVQSAKEGVRFDKDAAGRVVWVSYGEENGRPATYHEVPVSIASEGPRSASVRILAPAAGLHAASRPIAEGIVMHVEIVDGSTIAMSDPKKGRLVFHRVGPAASPDK